MEKLLNSKQVAERLGFTDQALRASRLSGVLCGVDTPIFFKIGTRVKYKESDIQAWIENNLKAFLMGK